MGLLLSFTPCSKREKNLLRNRGKEQLGKVLRVICAKYINAMLTSICTDNGIHGSLPQSLVLEKQLGEFGFLSGGGLGKELPALDLTFKFLQQHI